MNNVNIVALIPARRDSKGIKFKNRQEIGGVSLVGHALNFAKGCNFDEIIISTDDEYFYEHKVFSKYCHRRDKDLSGDKSIVADVVKRYSLDTARKNDFFVVLEPTCFERKKHHLDFLFSGDFFLSNKSTFTSFVETPVHKEKIWGYKGGKMIPHPNVWKRRQEYEKQYVLSGHYYGLFLAEIIELYPSLCDGDVYPLIIDDDFHIDIDNKIDLDIARIVLSGSDSK